MKQKDSRKLKNQRIFMSLAVILFVGLIVASSRDSQINWLAYWWMAPISLIIAIVVNTAGLSGAALFVPFFVLVFPLISGKTLETSESIQLALVTESFGLTSSALSFAAFKLIDYRLGFRIIVGALPFVILGSFLSFYVSSATLHFAISGVLFISVFLMSFGHSRTKKAKPKSKVKRVDSTGKSYSYDHSGHTQRFVGYGVGGLFQGLTGFGIGELGIIAMVRTKIPIRVAIGTSHMIVSITAISASLLHLVRTEGQGLSLPLNIVVMTVPAVVIGGQIAPYLSASLPIKTLHKGVSLLFLILSIALLFVAIREL